jgi:putative transposase
MPDYRRHFVAGGTWFFTVNLADRSQALLTQHIGLLRDVVRQVRSRHSFLIDAMVVLPDHLHALWTLPQDDSDYPMRWRLIKSGFSRALPLAEIRSASRVGHGERGVWQRRYWEHAIRDETDFERHVDYIHYNPVKHGHAVSAHEWPYSSFHQYVRDGLLRKDWGSERKGEEGKFGE